MRHDKVVLYFLRYFVSFNMRIDFSIVSISPSASVTPSNQGNTSKFQYILTLILLLLLFSQHGVLQKCYEIIFMLNFLYATSNYENKHER